MRTITLRTIHVGALEKYSRLSNKYDEVVNRTLMAIEVMEDMERTMPM